MAFTKTDTADIEVSYDEAKFNFPHNRSGYRKFLQFIPPTEVFRFDKEVRKTLAGCIRDMSEYILYGNSIPVEYMLSAILFIFIYYLIETFLKVFLFEVGKQFFLGFNQLSKHLIEKIKKNYFHKSYFTEKN